MPITIFSILSLCQNLFKPDELRYNLLDVRMPKKRREKSGVNRFYLLLV